MWVFIRVRLLGLAIAEDEAANALLGPGSVPAAGNPHYTLSQRCSEMRERGEVLGCVLCGILNVIFKPFNWSVEKYDHCTEAMKGMPESVSTEG